MRRITFAPTWDAWRDAARAAWAEKSAPAIVAFVSQGQAQGHLFAQEAPAPSQQPEPSVHKQHRDVSPLRLPKTFVEAAQIVALHRDDARWDLMYRLLWRLAQNERSLMQDPADADVALFWRMHKAVLHDIHNCHAYVRFRPVTCIDAEQPLLDGAPQMKHYVAWYEPDHLCLPRAAPHFATRFAQMDWTLMTPDACAIWRDGVLTFEPGVPKPSPASLAQDDAMETLWRVYYESIFNPARLNMRATRQHMPQRFWKNMPETELIAKLATRGAALAESFVQQQTMLPERPQTYEHLQALGAAVQACTACPWAAQATQAVVGEGTEQCALMIVGEQPGDMEDLQGRPFVGPAGKLLAQALQQAGIERDAAYITNAVKHFKFEMRGKRRIHQKPGPKDVAACQHFLAAEWQLVRPRVVLCLGTTAALAVFGKAVKLKDVRGGMHQTAACAHTYVTTHPSAILRMPAEAQEAAMQQFVADLGEVRSWLESHGAGPAS